MAGKKSKTAAVVETEHDEIGFWSELKLDILRKYWPEYTKIVKGQDLDFQTLYIDAFAGSGQHISKSTREFVKGSPARALDVKPPFDEYHFIDMDEAKVRSLEQLASSKRDVTVHHGDCNRVLLEEVFPRARYEDYRRAVCLLDPYKLQLDWNVIGTAAQMKSVEIFLNFPIMDMNRTVFHDKATPQKEEAMTRFWGDETWRDAVFQTNVGLFDTYQTKIENRRVAEAFGERLKSVAGFKFVPEPMAMRNSQHSTVYYLFFAGQNETGSKIVKWIFDDYRKKGFGR